MGKIETFTVKTLEGKPMELTTLDNSSFHTKRHKPRLYELQKYDVFLIDLNTFMKSSIYWSKIFQIQKFETKWYKKKILFFKIPWRKYIMVQLMYMGEKNCVS